MSDEMVWLEYLPTGGKAQFPASAVPLWEAKGWLPCEPDLTSSVFHDPPEVVAAAREAEIAAGRLEPDPVVEPEPLPEDVTPPLSDAVEAPAVDVPPTQSPNRRRAADNKEV